MIPSELSNMTEDLLCYIWQQKLFNTGSLSTTEGEPLSIVHSGIRNHHAGPDFTQAKVRIGKDLLVGNIEIHVNASDWKKHNHQKDNAYSNVILHVVYVDDAAEITLGMPTLELKDKIHRLFLSRYETLMKGQRWIPCEQQINEVDPLIIQNGLHRLIIERLEQKTADVLERLALNKNSWEETFYQITARNFGLKVNSEAFDALAKSLPLKIISKHKNSLLQIESLLFGQAGMLETTFSDEYPNALKKEYRFLQKKYALEPMKAQVWKFMRLRPSGFPTVRIAQFAMLLFRSTHLFSKILEADSIRKIIELLQTETSEYWLNHYRFDIASKSIKKPLGKDFSNAIIINAIVPVMFIYGKTKDNPYFQDKALNLLETLPSEKNAILSKWKNLGISSRSAYDSQALLQLKNQYCSDKKCLHCMIGNKLLRSGFQKPFLQNSG